MDVIFKETISEIEKIDYLFEKYYQVFELTADKTPDDIMVAASGSVIHSFYNGVENLFKTVNKVTDNKIFTGEKTHSEMLEFMNSGTSKRKQVITENTKDTLYEYMRFRHFYRHNYNFDLLWNKLGPLVVDCPKCWETLKKETTDFMQKHLENNVVIPAMKKADKKTKGTFDFKAIESELDSNGKENLKTFFSLKKLDTQEQQEKFLSELFIKTHTRQLKLSAESIKHGVDVNAVLKEHAEEKQSPAQNKSKDSEGNHLGR